MKVKIYTTNTCPYCVYAKNYLEERKIKFEELNVQNNKEAAKEMIEKSGQMGVPVIDINGTIIVGFDRAAIDEELKKTSL